MRRNTMRGTLLPLFILLISALGCSLTGGEASNAEPDTPIEETDPDPEEAVVEDETEPTEIPEPLPTKETESEPEPASPTAVPVPEVSNAITLGNVKDIEELRLFQVSQSGVWTSPFSPIGHQLATFGYDGLVRVWDADTGDLLSEMDGFIENGFALSYAPDGSIISSGGRFNIQLWDVNSAELQATIQVNADVFRIAWAPDGSQMVVVGGGSSRALILDGSTGQEIQVIQPGQLLSEASDISYTPSVLWSSSYHPDGNSFALSDSNGTVFIVDSSSFELLAALPDARGAGWDLEYSPDGSLLASCNDQGGDITIWDTASWEVVMQVPNAHGDECSDGHFGAVGDMYISVGADGMLNVWDVQSGVRVMQIAYGRYLWWVSVSADGELISVAHDDGSVRIIGIP